MIQKWKKTDQSKNCYETVNMFMWKTRAPAHTSITWFQDIWQLSLWIWCVFLMKTPMNQNSTVTLPTMTFFVPETSACHETEERNSEREDRSSHMEGARVATVRTTPLHPFPWQSCLTAAHHQIHCHRYITDAFKVFLRYTIEALDHLCCCTHRRTGSFCCWGSRHTRRRLDHSWLVARTRRASACTWHYYLYLWPPMCSCSTSQIDRMIKSHQTSSHLKCLKPSSLSCLLVHLCTKTMPQILMCCKNNNCSIILKEKLWLKDTFKWQYLSIVPNMKWCHKCS